MRRGVGIPHLAATTWLYRAGYDMRAMTRGIVHCMVFGGRDVACGLWHITRAAYNTAATNAAINDAAE